MAGGTDEPVSSGGGTPAVVLVEPQLAENIGMVARAMLNCGLDDLRLVRPRADWPNEKAVAAASGADRVLERARLYPSTAAATADLSLLFATTARTRAMTKWTLTPRAAASEIRRATAAGIGVGLLFGKEARGLGNDDVALSQAIIAIPLNPTFSSLNLAMAVLIVGYEWRMAANAVETAADATPLAAVPGAVLQLPKETAPATAEQLQGLFEQLESELDRCGFLRITEKRPIMVRNLRNLFGRAGLSAQEVRTLRGIISCLVAGPRRPRGGSGGA
ncbi:MAG: RNA methyltransferase [Defluviicoccus sp.]|nr:RNA methyltransferase [Defluviicoccus sp.]MDG4607925.1 RNA methyltransferase [Defluviicoccus sp.]